MDDLNSSQGLPPIQSRKVVDSDHLNPSQGLPSVQPGSTSVNDLFDQIRRGLERIEQKKPPHERIRFSSQYDSIRSAAKSSSRTNVTNNASSSNDNRPFLFGSQLRDSLLQNTYVPPAPKPAPPAPMKFDPPRFSFGCDNNLSTTTSSSRSDTPTALPPALESTMAAWRGDPYPDDASSSASSTGLSSPRSILNSAPREPSRRVSMMSEQGLAGALAQDGSVAMATSGGGYAHQLQRSQDETASVSTKFKSHRRITLLSDTAAATSNASNNSLISLIKSQSQDNLPSRVKGMPSGRTASQRTRSSWTLTQPVNEGIRLPSSNQLKTLANSTSQGTLFSKSSSQDLLRGHKPPLTISNTLLQESAKLSQDRRQSKRRSSTISDSSMSANDASWRSMNSSMNSSCLSNSFLLSSSFANGNELFSSSFVNGNGGGADSKFPSSLLEADTPTSGGGNAAASAALTSSVKLPLSALREDHSDNSNSDKEDQDNNDTSPQTGKCKPSESGSDTSASSRKARGKSDSFICPSMFGRQLDEREINGLVAFAHKWIPAVKKRRMDDDEDTR